jgi:hypothetical protein
MRRSTAQKEASLQGASRGGWEHQGSIGGWLTEVILGRQLRDTPRDTKRPEKGWDGLQTDDLRPFSKGLLNGTIRECALLPCKRF